MSVKSKSQKSNSKIAAHFLLFPCALCCLLFDCSLAQSRIAILDFVGEREASNHLRKLADKAEFTQIDVAQLEIAVKGSGYNGSLNLTLDEARALGLSIGCDYYIVGIARVLRRLGSASEFYFDVMLGTFLVETSSGKLINFSFEKAQTANEILAHRQLLNLAEKIWLSSTVAIKSAAGKSVNAEEPQQIYEVDSAEAVRLKIKPPQFFRRVKPTYTETASFGNITATIELKVVFQSDGRIGAVEIMRWGGFGLDESALATVRQLKFEPAKIAGSPVNVSAIVRYNFGQEEKAK